MKAFRWAGKVDRSLYHRMLVEMLSITLAVLLGFIVNEWREEQRARREAQIALDHVIQEIECNQMQLGERSEYYRSILTQIDTLGVGHWEEPFSVGSIENWKGVFPPVIRLASYRAAMATGALPHLDFRISDQLAMAVISCETVQDVLTWSLRGVMTGDLETWGDAHRVFQMLWETSQIGNTTLGNVLKELEKSRD